MCVCVWIAESYGGRLPDALYRPMYAMLELVVQNCDDKGHVTWVGQVVVIAETHITYLMVVTLLVDSGHFFLINDHHMS